MNAIGLLQRPSPSRARKLLWPSVTTALMLAITIGLGVWQLQRLAWKTALLTDIDRAEAAPAIRLPPAPAPFTKVEVTGHFRDDLAAYYGADVRPTPSGPVMGAQLVMPLERPGGDPVLVDRGWLPEGAAIPPSRDQVMVIGYVRPAEQPTWFTGTDDPVKRRFYELDPSAIGAALGLSRVAPFTLVALGQPDGKLAPAQALPRPPNDHLSYAITWFSLAACLLGVFGAYVRKALRQ